MKQFKKSSQNSSAAASAPPWENCPAKTNPVKTVRRHALETGAVFEKLRQMLNLPENLLPPATLFFALSHDCGKISPAFISRLPPDFNRQYNITPPLRHTPHAVISEAAMRDFLRRRDDRAEAIVAWHHGSYQPDHEPDVSILFGGGAWSEQRQKFLHWAGTCAPPLPETLSPETQMLTAGLVCLADWIASDANNFAVDLTQGDFAGLLSYAADRLDNIGFTAPQFRPGLAFADIFPFQPNEAQSELAGKLDGPGIYLLENTMGSGKTEAALYAAYKQISTGVNHGLFFALPTRLTSNRMHGRLEQFLRKVSVTGHSARLIHGTAWLEAAGDGELAPGRTWFAPAKRALLEPFGIGTIDQALKGTLHVKHFFLRLAALAGKVVVIDEVHSYDNYMHSLLVQLCRTLVNLRCTVILLSATLPEKRQAELIGANSFVPAQGYPRLTVNTGNPKSLALTAPRCRTVRIAPVAPEAVVTKAVAAARSGCNVAIIANTVNDAQTYARLVRQEIADGEFPVGLLTSRFPLWRRAEIENNWLNALGNGSDARRPHGSILTTTQIIESSVDIDFDLMISEPAPGDLMFQRMGRLWRHIRSPRPLPEPEFYWVDRQIGGGDTMQAVQRAAGGAGKIYPLFLLRRAEQLWRAITEIELPRQMPPLLEANYRAPDPAAAKLEHELYAIMEQQAERRKNIARSFAQPDLLSAQCAIAGDGEDAPTRLIEYRQRELLLLKNLYDCGDVVELTLSDDSVMRLSGGEKFALDNMKRLAANLVQVPVWCLPPRTDALPDSLATYWRHDAPLPVMTGMDGVLRLYDGTRLALGYNNEDGVYEIKRESNKEEDENVSFD